MYKQQRSVDNWKMSYLSLAGQHWWMLLILFSFSPVYTTKTRAPIVTIYTHYPTTGAWDDRNRMPCSCCWPLIFEKWLGLRGRNSYEYFIDKFSDYISIEWEAFERNLSLCHIHSCKHSNIPHQNPQMIVILACMYRKVFTFPQI